MSVLRRILVIGNFGYNSSVYNGQSIRTRTVYDSITKYQSESKVEYIDVSNRSKKQKLVMLFKIITADEIILMPGRDGIARSLRLIEYLSKSKRTTLVVIGGWLGDKVDREESLKKLLNSLKGILVQTKMLKNQLDELSVKNVHVFPNYRNISEIKIDDSRKNGRSRFCFYSRVCREKGTEKAVEAVKRYNSEHDDLITLDVYGPIQQDYSQAFYSGIEVDQNINYYGIVENSESIRCLSNYDCMLFPTTYDGEGFPGVILESYMAGTPVIASLWKFNNEYVFSGVTGYLHEAESTEDLYDKIIQFKLADIDFKKNCLKEAKKYSEENVYPILDRIIMSGR